MSERLFWGAPEWFWPAVGLGGMAALVLLIAYARSPFRGALPWVAAALKLTAIAALALCLLEPLVRSERPRPGANLFLVLSDTSRSMTIREGAGRPSRAEQLSAALRGDQWQSRLAETFEVRKYSVDARLSSMPDFHELKYEGRSSRLRTALETLRQRHRQRPVAGVLLFSDGNATDLAAGDMTWLQDMPPIYPVIVGRKQAPRDARVANVGVTQTLFETTPITVRVEAAADGMDGVELTAELLDEQGKLLQTKELGRALPDRRLTTEFLVKPDRAGVLFYQARVRDRSEPRAFESERATAEATLENNRRWTVAERGKGPYRVLYVCGRPNWELKFLRRAVQADDEIDMSALVRIAKREPKFDFRGRRAEGSNPLFRGFDPDTDDAERFDQPVLLRLVKDATELANGFPKTAEELFRFDALVLDDVEADFFTPDQMSLVHRFVSARGGGLLMLGGQESFAEGGFRRTRLDELLPVYLDPPSEPPTATRHQWSLTREGWLQPWVRTRPTEVEERERLAAMPAFNVLNRTALIKPGASVLAETRDEQGATRPALVSQRFGEGRAAALLVGDFWRWAMHADDARQRDEPDQAWRQTIRWLVSDVPRRVDIRLVEDESEQAVKIVVKVRDLAFAPLENARVSLNVLRPGGESFAVQATSSPDQAGEYVARYSNKDAGPYRVQASVTGPDGEMAGEAEAGWIADPEELELRSLQPDQAWLEDLARRTGGKAADLADLNRLVDELPRRKAPVSEPWVYPLWHQWTVFLFAACCLIGEWGLRRWSGLP